VLSHSIFHAKFHRSISAHLTCDFGKFYRHKFDNCASMRVDSALMDVGAFAIGSTTSDGSTASFKSSDMMLPNMDSGVSAPAKATASMSSIVHDTDAFKGTSPAPPPGTASLPDTSECFLEEQTVRPEVLARVVLQARLWESNSRRELERERTRTKALEALVQQLATDVRELRKAIARETDGSSGE
jgi:hypothetical protein